MYRYVVVPTHPPTYFSQVITLTPLPTPRSLLSSSGLTPSGQARRLHPCLRQPRPATRRHQTICTLHRSPSQFRWPSHRHPCQITSCRSQSTWLLLGLCCPHLPGESQRPRCYFPDCCHYNRRKRRGAQEATSWDNFQTVF